VGLASILESFGGALLLVGLFTRPVAFLLAGEMGVAYFIGHGSHGFWTVLNQGTPAVIYCFVWLYLSAAGAGPWSLHARAARSPRTRTRPQVPPRPAGSPRDGGRSPPGGGPPRSSPPGWGSPARRGAPPRAASGARTAPATSGGGRRPPSASRRANRRSGTAPVRLRWCRPTHRWYPRGPSSSAGRGAASAGRSTRSGTGSRGPSGSPDRKSTRLNSSHV